MSWEECLFPAKPFRKPRQPSLGQSRPWGRGPGWQPGDGDPAGRARGTAAAWLSPALKIHSRYPFSSRSICCCRRSFRKARRFSTRSRSLANSLWCRGRKSEGQVSGTHLGPAHGGAAPWARGPGGAGTEGRGHGQPLLVTPTPASEPSCRRHGRPLLSDAPTPLAGAAPTEGPGGQEAVHTSCLEQAWPLALLTRSPGGEHSLGPLLGRTGGWGRGGDLGWGNQRAPA